MSQQNKDEAETLDKELDRLRNLIEKENDMLRKMIKSLDALEKKMINAGERDSYTQKKPK